MHISIFQAILLGLLYYLTNNGTPWVTGLGSVSAQQSTHCTLDSSMQVEHFRQMPVSVVS